MPEHDLSNLNVLPVEQRLAALEECMAHVLLRVIPEDTHLCLVCACSPNPPDGVEVSPTGIAAINEALEEGE